MRSRTAAMCCANKEFIVLLGLLFLSPTLPTAVLISNQIIFQHERGAPHRVYIIVLVDVYVLFLRIMYILYTWNIIALRVKISYCIHRMNTFVLT